MIQRCVAMCIYIISVSISFPLISYCHDHGPGPSYAGLHYTGGNTTWEQFHTTCIPGSQTYVEITTGSHANAGTDSENIWFCVGKHKSYKDIQPPYTRIETDWYDDNPNAGTHDAACVKLSRTKVNCSTTVCTNMNQLYYVNSRTNCTSVNNDNGCVDHYGPMASRNTTYRHYLCDELVGFNEVFSWLEPDDWDSIRLLTKSKDGIQISRIRIRLNNVQIYDSTEDNGGSNINVWLDKYYNRQKNFYKILW